MWSTTFARCPHSTHIGFSRRNKARSLRHRVELYRGSRFTRSPGLRWVLCQGLGLCRLGMVAIEISRVSGKYVQLLTNLYALRCATVFGVQHAQSLVSEVVYQLLFLAVA